MLKRSSIFLCLLVMGCVSTQSATNGLQRIPPPILKDSWYQDGIAALAAAKNRGANKNQARNVIFFVGDGMSLATVTAARILEGQAQGGTGEEHLLSFERFPFTGLAKVYNTNAQVPDSAGTATAMLSGVKTKMGVVGVGDNVIQSDCASLEASSVPTLLEHAESAGMATGIISTARITHATPAAAYAHTPARGWEYDGANGIGDCVDIARQLVEFTIGDGPEVILGGGRAMFLPRTSRDPEYPDKTGSRLDTDLIAQWQQANPDGEFVWNTRQFRSVNFNRTSKLLGLFEPSHMQYEADRNTTDAGEPALKDLVGRSIEMLSRTDGGFFLFVEAGRIDHAHHRANAYRALHDTIALSDAVRVAKQMTDSEDTLIIVTADHGHVMAMAGYPRRGNPILGKVKPPGTTSNYSKDALGLPYTTLLYANGPGYTGASDDQPEGPKKAPHYADSISGISLGRPDLSDVDTTDQDYLQEGAIPMLSETHSGTDVVVYADGPGAWLVQGVHEQNYLFHVMNNALFNTN